MEILFEEGDLEPEEFGEPPKDRPEIPQKRARGSGEEDPFEGFERLGKSSGVRFPAGTESEVLEGWLEPETVPGASGGELRTKSSGRGRKKSASARTRKAAPAPRSDGPDEDGIERISFQKPRRKRKTARVAGPETSADSGDTPKAPGVKTRPSLLSRAVGALARRDYSKRELRDKLLKSLEEGEEAGLVDETLALLEKKGFLSDERYAEGRVRARSYRLGDARLRWELRRRGLGAETVDRAMETMEEPEEIRACRLWRRHFGEPPGDFKAREKQIRWLAYRGFGMRTVIKVVEGRVRLPEDPPEDDGD